MTAPGQITLIKFIYSGQEYEKYPGHSAWEFFPGDSCAVPGGLVLTIFLKIDKNLEYEKINTLKGIFSVK